MGPLSIVGALQLDVQRAKFGFQVRFNDVEPHSKPREPHIILPGTFRNSFRDLYQEITVAFGGYV